MTMNCKIGRKLPIIHSSETSVDKAFRASIILPFILTDHPSESVSFLWLLMQKPDIFLALEFSVVVCPKNCSIRSASATDYGERLVSIGQ